MFRKKLLVVALVVSTLSVTTPATAAATYGFESGDFASFSLAGAAAVVSSFSGFTPTEGGYFAVLKTSDYDGDGSPVNTNAFGGTSGTILSLNVNFAVGQVLSFDYSFVSKEVTEASPANDFSLADSI